MTNRTHLKRKPPKLKVKVIDGSGSKTKYVRMTPVVDVLKVTKEENATAHFANIDPTSQLHIPENATSETCLTSASTKNTVTYSQKRRKLIEAWDKLRSQLLTTRIEELSPSSHSCCFCDEEIKDIIYCQDCGPSAYYCRPCCTGIHRNILFHKPHQWKDFLYVPVLMTNEFTRRDHDCETSYRTTIYSVDAKGTQHTCQVQLCHCEDTAVTLLRYNLWAATPTSPKIAFDLRFMELLSVLQLESHLPAKMFCEALACMHSNFVNVITNVEKNIYRAVVGDCLTEYNYHRSSLFTRNNITDSTFGMECPICLKTPPIVCMDANFGLVHKVSSGEGHGRHFARHKSSYFLNHENLKRFIDDYAADKKTSYSECSNFQAGSVIRSKVKNKKLDVTGIFGSVCKHDIPIHVMDLAHGERLSYPVYLLQYLLENRKDDNLVVMYDIACMLHKHLKKTDNKSILDKCSFAVPVFHSYAHNTSCQLTYGQRYAQSTGLTDGEGIERLWSYLRGFQRITKEMSIGNRQDLLSEAMLHHTEKQIWNLGQRLAEKKKRCDKILVDTDTTLTHILSDLNESKEMIDVWFADWKSLCTGNDHKVCSLTADEQYAECLQNLESEKEFLNNAEEEAKEQIERNIEKLTNECKRIRKKATFKDLTVQSDQLKMFINSARQKKKKLSLTKLKELSTERQYLSSMMKKYAEGQDIGIRISKQFSINYNKIKKEVEHFNLIDDGDEDIKTFLCPSSSVYDPLTTRKLSEKQQKAVQTKLLNDHAKEECSNIEKELKQLVNELSVQSVEILNLIDHVSTLEKSRYNSGKLQYLHHKHLNIENLFNSCSCIFEDEVDTTIIPSKVRNILHDVLTLNQTSSDVEMPSEEEMQTILEEIETLENNHNNVEDEDEDEVEDIE